MGYNRGMAGLIHHAPSKPFALPKRMTSAEYWDLPDDAPRCELIHGEVCMVPTPDSWHQTVSKRLLMRLVAVLESTGKGEVFDAPLGLTLPDNTELQPDLFVLNDGHPQYGVRFKSITHPPLLVIEILSPSNRKHDRQTKFELYQEFGVPNYWIADPETRSINAWTLVDGEYQPMGQASAPSKVAFPPFTDLILDLEAIFPKAG